MFSRKLTNMCFLTVLFFSSGIAHAEERLQPFILASTAAGDLATVVTEVKNNLGAAGFDLVGEYSPYADAVVIIVTSEALKNAAAKSEFGGYAAGQRISVTTVDDEVQVAYTNPVYMANAYRMTEDLSDVATALQTALGNQEAFGSKKGLLVKKIRKYHYMFGMEYFDDPTVLARYESFEQAVDAVEQALAAGKGGASKVYRIDVPNKQEAVFGVQLTEGCSGDEFIMGHIDFKPLRSSAHLPYEMLVSGNRVYALYARFRIAINFPDLKMMGSNSFLKIMCSPKAIKNALKQAAGKEIKKAN